MLLSVVRGTVSTGLVLVLLGGLLTGGAMAGGYLRVDDPQPATAELVTGGIQAPEATLGSSDGTGSTSGVTVANTGNGTLRLHTTVSIDNRANEVGGRIESIEYRAGWAPSRDGAYSRLGSWELSGGPLVPDGTVTLSDTRELRTGTAARLADRLESEGASQPAYIRVVGTARITIGPFWSRIDFRTIVKHPRTDG